MKVKFLLAFVLSLAFCSSVFSNVYTVTKVNGNTWGTGDPGSLIRAISDADGNPGRDTIRFAVPTNQVNFTGYSINVTKNNIFFDGISTLNSQPVKLNLTLSVSAKKIDFYGVRFHKTAGHALILTGGNNSVDSCFFTNTGNGKNSLWINGGNGTTVTNSVFTGSTIQGHAISVENGGNHTIDNCTITGIKDVAIIVRGTGDNVISNCSTSAGKHNGIGLIAPNNIVENCVSFDNDWAGIVCDNWNGGCNGNIVRNNEVYGNNKNLGVYNPEQAGITSNGPDTEIYGNIVYNNGANGILINKVNGKPCNNQIVRDNIIGTNSNGDELGNGWNGIFVWSVNGANVQGNTIVNNGYGDSHTIRNMPDRISGIRFQEVTSGTIHQNYVGTDANKIDAGNAFDGITLHTNVTGVTVTENISCYNGFKAHSKYGSQGGGGLAIRNGSGNNVVISSNFIGVHEDLSDGGNKDYGISAEGATNLLIGGNTSADGNVIGYTKNVRDASTNHHGCGIWLVLGATTNSEVYNNEIIDNGGPGVLIDQDAKNNIVGASGKGNTLLRNEYGIMVTSSGAIENTLRFNSFSCNASGGISLQNGGNEEYGGADIPKTITVNKEATGDFITGYAPSANAVVDIYLQDNVCSKICEDSVNQGMTMVASVTADPTPSGSGRYEWRYDFVAGGNLVDEGNVIVLATEAGTAGSVNTSEFSICIFECDTPKNSQVNSPDFNLCPEETADLTANSFGKNSPGYTYDWYLGSVDPANLVHSVVDDSTYSTGIGGDYIVVISNVTAPNSCADTSAPVAVMQNLNPVIDLVPSSTSLCSGGTVNLDANASPTLTYSWTPGGETDPDIAITTGGDYGVTVTNAAGCDTSANVTITEFEISDDIAINSPDLSICPEETALLTANATGLSPTDGYTYTWYLNSIASANVVSSSSETSYSTSVGGDYFVVVSNDASGDVCTDTSASVALVQNLNPVIDLVPSSTSLCSGGVVNLDANASPALTYSWTPGGESDPDIDISTGGDYGVTVTNAAGCDTSANVTITEFEISDDIAINSSDLSICPEETAVLTANATGLSPTDDYTYTWYLNSIGSGSVVNTSTASTYDVALGGDYFVVISNDESGGDCADTSTAVEVVQNLNPVINLVPSSTSLCSGGTVNLDANASPALTYDWTPSGAGPNIDVTSGGDYGVTVTNAAGCDTSANVTITEFEISDDIAINASTLSLCRGESANLTAVATGLSTTDSYTYTWYLNSIGSGNVVNTSSEATYATDNEGDYIVVVSNNASGDVCLDTSDVAVLTVNEIPTITLLPYTELCSGDTIDLEVDVTDIGMDILWSGGESDFKIRVFKGGEYSVTVKDPATECDTSAVADVIENSKPEVSMEDITFCQDDSVLISAGVSDMEYVWSPNGKTVESFYIYESDTLAVKVTNPVTGCVTNDTVQAIQSPEPKPLLDLPNDSSMCPSEGDEIEINAIVTSELSGVLTWSNGIIDESAIIANDTIDYWAMFVDSFGCEAADTMSILGECIPPDPDLPNVMTKDNPWRPIGDITPQQVLRGSFVLYNRWGRVIYTFLDKKGLPVWKGYNDQGIECSAGVYYWTWEFEDNNYNDRFYNGYIQKLDLP